MSASKIVTKSTTYASFEIAVPGLQFKEVFRPELWPSGCAFKGLKFRRAVKTMDALTIDRPSTFFDYEPRTWLTDAVLNTALFDDRYIAFRRSMQQRRRCAFGCPHRRDATYGEYPWILVECVLYFPPNRPKYITAAFLHKVQAESEYKVLKS